MSLRKYSECPAAEIVWVTLQSSLQLSVTQDSKPLEKAWD